MEDISWLGLPNVSAFPLNDLFQRLKVFLTDIEVLTVGWTKQTLVSLWALGNCSYNTLHYSEHLIENLRHGPKK